MAAWHRHGPSLRGRPGHRGRRRVWPWRPRCAPALGLERRRKCRTFPFPLADGSTACYTDRKPRFRILCGSIQTLVAHFGVHMTLLTTEIHNPNDPHNALIVFAADRRISRGGSCCDCRKKILRIPGFNAGIGYFGLAEILQDDVRRPMAEWLQDFLMAKPVHANLQQFSKELMKSLNRAVPRQCQQSQISGFHIAGFNAQGLPEFWFVRNVADDCRTILGEYQVREDFQRRDAPRLPAGAFQVYRNGDLRAHVVAWENIDNSLGSLLKNIDFRQLTTPEEYVAWVRFKMEMIARFYEKFCTRSIIGGAVDAFAIAHK